MKLYQILKTLFLIIFSIVAFESKAQWLPTGTVTTDAKYRYGPIGIGLATQYPGVLPAYRISLGNDYVNTKIALNDGSGTLYGIGVQSAQMRFHVNASTSKFSFYDAAGGNEVFNIKGTGELQITSAGGNSNRKFVMWEASPGDLNQFVGFGLQPAILRYQVDAIGASHVFYAGTSSSTSNELMRIQGDGKVGIGTSTPFAKFHLNNGALLLDGTTGNTPLNGVAELGAGTRMMWIPAKSAFRAGYSTSTNWDNANIGLYSVALGYGTKASGQSSVALGSGTASGAYSFAAQGSAIGQNSVALNGSYAQGAYSVAIGYSSTAAAGMFAFAAGASCEANNSNSLALGSMTRASAAKSHVIGAGFTDANDDDWWLENGITNSLMIGYNSNIPTMYIGSSNGYNTTGAVAIGTTFLVPGYKFIVDGKVLCTELKVKASTNWPDYVFSPSYKIMSLDSVAQYITENKHLPEVPSAKEMEENGINTGEMGTLLMKKVEELTLYMIAQKKEIDQLKEKNSKLEEKVEALTK